MSWPETTYNFARWTNGREYYVRVGYAVARREAEPRIAELEAQVATLEQQLRTGMKEPGYTRASESASESAYIGYLKDRVTELEAQVAELRKEIAHLDNGYRPIGPIARAPGEPR